MACIGAMNSHWSVPLLLVHNRPVSLLLVHNRSVSLTNWCINVRIDQFSFIYLIITSFSVLHDKYQLQFCFSFFSTAGVSIFIKSPPLVNDFFLRSVCMRKNVCGYDLFFAEFKTKSISIKYKKRKIQNKVFAEEIYKTLQK